MSWGLSTNPRRAWAHVRFTRTPAPSAATSSKPLKAHSPAADHAAAFMTRCEAPQRNQWDDRRSGPVQHSSAQHNTASVLVVDTALLFNQNCVQTEFP